MATEFAIDELRSSLPWGRRVVLSAPTGTGKSTRVPVWFAEHGRVLVIEPRRVACRSLCRYVSQGTSESVGYAVRFEREGVEEPRILFVTTGVALRLAAGNQLGDFDTIVLDEFHERTLEQDLLLALLPHKAPAARWVVMSATLEVAPLVRFLGAEERHCPAPGFPVAVSYLGGPLLPSRENLARRVGQGVQRALAETKGNVLVFLPGMGEIQECRSALGSLGGVEVVVLHGSLSSVEQDRAFQAGPRRVVLATNVAETSVTLPGITAVVDSGLVRQKIHRKGFSALSTEAISLASADQRRGRAGRTEPGICLRLWQKEARLEKGSDPEMVRLDLTDLVTQAAACGADLLRLKFLDPPPEFALLGAISRLQSWGVLSESGEMILESALPLPVELARLAPLAPAEVLGDFLDVCALLQARASLFDAKAGSDAIEQRQKDLPGYRLAASLLALRRGHAQRHGLNGEALRQVREISQQLRALSGLPGSNQDAPRLDRLALFLARHWSERVFVRRPKREAFVNSPVGLGTSWEVTLDRGEELPEQTRAALLLEIQPLGGRSLRVELRARQALPCSVPILREAGLGEDSLDGVLWRSGRVVGTVVRQFAGLELERSEVELEGSLLRQGMTQLLLRGSLWRSEMEKLAEDHRLHRLQVLLEEREDPGTFESALGARLAQLGLESPEDVELIGPADVATCEVSEESRGRWAELFPAQLARGGAVYEVDYQVEGRKIVLNWRSGARNTAFPVGQLPRWSGWGVEVHERGRVTPMR